MTPQIVALGGTVGLPVCNKRSLALRNAENKELSGVFLIESLFNIRGRFLLILAHVLKIKSKCVTKMTSTKTIVDSQSLCGHA